MKCAETPQKKYYPLQVGLFGIAAIALLTSGYWLTKPSLIHAQAGAEENQSTQDQNGYPINPDAGTSANDAAADSSAPTATPDNSKVSDDSATTGETLPTVTNTNKLANGNIVTTYSDGGVLTTDSNGNIVSYVSGTGTGSSASGSADTVASSLLLSNGNRQTTYASGAVVITDPRGNVLSYVPAASSAGDAATGNASFPIFKFASVPNMISGALGNWGTLFPKLVQFIQYAAELVFAVLIIIGGVMYQSSFGDEESTKRARKLLLNSIIGLFIILAAQGIALMALSIAGVSSFGAYIPSVPLGKLNNPNNILPVIINFIQYAAELAFVALIIVGGITYQSSFGDEESTKRARKLILDAVIGLFIVLAAQGTAAFIIKQTGASSFNTYIPQYPFGGLLYSSATTTPSQTTTTKPAPTATPESSASPTTDNSNTLKPESAATPGTVNAAKDLISGDLTRF